MCIYMYNIYTYNYSTRLCHDFCRVRLCMLAFRMKLQLEVTIQDIVMCKVYIHDCMDMVCMCCSGATL